MAQYDYTVKFGAMTDKASFENVKRSLEEVRDTVAAVAQEMSVKDAGKELDALGKERLKQYKEMQTQVENFMKAFNEAENKSLGTFNLVKFNNKLKDSQVNVNSVMSAFGTLGSRGTRMFRDLSAEVMSTNRNLEKTTTFIDNMMTTMGNTIKWGISSSIMNSFTGAVQKSYNYVKDLDRSLNDIRIVSGKSADEMERFAKQANNAAKNLGATTLDYTNAALIYEQQGLSDKEVAGRSDVTVKMSNVLGTSADEVSNYMTAIWNNFYEEGGKTLEYYADVITALGAATASSAEEISTGLEKFAAIADTVGLSYEYATAALTTVTAATRQSAEVVGTAFKTLFARIQDLELGETLDDGTTLGKYSEALQSVGISIMDYNNELKDMDDILNEMGAKWDTLTKAQQVSLAQTVAGTRQYTQLVALMDNWDDFADNINTVKNATGELDRQQAIYLDGVEAHMKSMEAAWEGAYEAFFDEDTIKAFADAMKMAGDAVKNIVSGFGGGGNTILAVVSTIANLGSEHIARGLANIATNAKNAKNNAAILNAELEIMERFKGLELNDNVNKKLVQMKQDILSYGKLVSDDQQNLTDSIINTLAQLYNQKEAFEEGAEAAAAYASRVQLAYQANAEEGITVNHKEALEMQSKDVKSAQKASMSYDQQIIDLEEELSKSNFSPEEILQKWQNLTAEMTKNMQTNWRVLFESAGDNAKEFTAQLLKTDELLQSVEKAQKGDKKKKKKNPNAMTLDFTESDINDISQAVKKLASDFYETTEQIKESNPSEFLKQYSEESIQQMNETNKKIEETEGKFESLKSSLNTTETFNSITSLAGATGQLAAGLISIKNIGNIIDDDLLSTSDKVLQIFTSIATTIPMMINGVTSFISSAKDIGSSIGKLVVARAFEIQAKKDEAKANAQLAATSGAAAIGETALAGANAAAGGSAAAAVPSIGAMSAAIWSILWPIGLVMVAIAALTAAIYGIVKAYNKDADAAAAAAEQAEEARKRYEETTQAAEELKETLSDYNEGIESLSALADNAEAFESALKKVNDQARELIKTYGLWDEWHYGENGEIVINEDAQQRIQQQANEKAFNAEMQMYGAEIQAGKTAVKSKQTNLQRDVGGVITEYYDDYGNSAYDRNSKELEGSVTHQYSRQLTDEETQWITDALNSFGEDLEAMSDEQLAEALQAMDGIPPAVDANIESILKHRDALEEQAYAEKEFADSALYYSKQIMKGMVEQKYGSEINKLASTVDKDGNVTVNEGRASLISSIVANEEEDLTKKMNKELKNIDTSKATSNNKLNKHYGYNVKNDEDLAKTYAKEVLGMSDSEVAQLTYKGGIDKGTLKTKDGTKVLDGYSDDKMRKELARVAKEKEIKKKYEKQLSGKATLEDIEGVMDAGYEAGADYGVDFTDAFLQTMANGNKKIDLSSSFQELDPQEMQELMGMADADVASTLGIGEEDWKAMGYTSAEEFGKSFKEGLNGWEWDRDSAVKNEAAKLDLESYDLESEELEDYAKHLMNVSSKSGDLADSLETDAEASAKVAKSVMRMNNGVETLSENFDDWKDVMKKSSKESEEYHEALSGMQGAVADLLDTEDEYVSDDFLQKHFEDIEKAANGDAEAIDRLKFALAEDIVMKVAINNDVSAEKQAEIKTWLQEIQDMSKDIEIGTNIDLEGMEEDEAKLMENMQNIINAAGMTAEEANAAFSAMGYQTNFAMEPVDVEQTVPNTVTETKMIDSKVNPITGAIEYQKVQTSSYQDGVSTFTGKQMQIKMETSEDGKKVPVIDSIVKTGTGSMNNYSKKNKGGKSAGGGSKPSKVEKTKGAKDIYHDVNIKLKQISNNLDKVQKQQDHLVGKALIENLAEQYALLNKQLDTTAEKMRIAEGEAAELRKKLENKGVKFNADGTMSNYAEAYDKQLAKLNAIESKYEKMSEKQREKYQETYDKAKEEWEEFLDNMSRYDEVITDEIPGMMSEIRDVLNEQIELKLEAFEYEVKIRLDLAEAKKEWNEFKADILEGKDLDNDPLAAAKVNKQNMDTYYNNDGTGSLQATTTHINKIMEQLAQMDADQVAGVYGETYTYKNSKGEDVTIDYNNRAKALEDLKTYIDENIGGLTEFNELMGDIYGNYVDLLGKIQEGFDKQAEAFDTLDSMIQHDMELIKMAYGEEAYDKLSELYDKDLENSKAKLAAASAQVDYWKKEVAEQRAYVATLEEGTDEWWRASEALTAAEESLNGAIDAESQAVLDAMQKVTDKLLFNIDKVFSELNKSLTDGLGLEYASLEWELIGAKADDYLDTVNAIYSTQQLQNKYLDAIEKSSNPAHQKKLNDLMEQETKYLREQDKLSQYDLDRANLKYELALKQIALEEAQQNKSKLRLRRDSQGNYTYQYTADDDQVSSVQQEINDLYNQLYNLDAEEYRGNLEKIYDVWAEAQEKMREAAQINDPKVRKEYEELITKEYGERINALTEENENIKSNLYQSTMSQLLELYNTDTANYEQMTEDQKAILDEYITAETELNGAAFDNIFGLYNKNIVNLQSMADSQKDVLMTSLVPQWNSAYQKMTDAIVGEGGFENTLKVAFADIMEQARLAFEELAKYETEYREKSDDNKNYIQDQLTSAEKLLKMYQEDLPEIKTLIADLATAWNEVATAIGNATTAASNYYTTAQENNADDAADTDQPGDTGGNNEPSGQSEDDGAPDTGGNKDTGSNNKPSLTKGSSIKLKAGTKWYSNSYGGGNYGSTSKQKSVTITLVNENGSHPYHVNQLGWVRKKDIVGYASGGYTGDWAGSDGRLAMLHKKELILNAHDTDNMLDAITILRDITSNLGATLLNKMASINASGVGALGAAGTAAGLEQIVTINAEFPNVTNSHEIEDAINNLVNRASQHISK